MKHLFVSVFDPSLYSGLATLSLSVIDPMLSKFTRTLKKEFVRPRTFETSQKKMSFDQEALPQAVILPEDH